MMHPKNMGMVDGKQNIPDIVILGSDTITSAPATDRSEPDVNDDNNDHNTHHRRRRKSSVKRLFPNLVRAISLLSANNNKDRRVHHIADSDNVNRSRRTEKSDQHNEVEQFPAPLDTSWLEAYQSKLLAMNSRGEEGETRAMFVPLGHWHRKYLPEPVIKL